MYPKDGALLKYPKDVAETVFYDNERVLYERDSWALLATGHLSDMLIAHNCGSEANVHDWRYSTWWNRKPAHELVGLFRKCWHCGQPTPEDIVTIATLLSMN